MLTNNLQALLDLLQAFGELLPVIHDDSGVALLLEELGHLLHLLLAFLDTIDTDVANKRDASTHGGCGTALAVLDGDTLRVLDTQLLASVVVDGGVRLARGGIQAGSSTVDMLVWKVLVEASLLQRGNNTGLGRSADNGHGVTLLLEFLELLRHTGAGLALLAQLGSDGTELTVDVGINLLRGHSETMLLLEAHKHATEVVTNKVLE